MIYIGKFKVTSPFGWRTLNGERNNHKGIDVVGIDDKNIRAVVAGTVGRSTMLDKATDTTLTWQWGNYVRVDGDDGNLYYYCHMSKRIAKVGQRVEIGDILGVEGNTGYSFGSHCHFEVRKGGISVNPAPFIGVPNTVGEYTAPAKKADKYTVNGFTIERLSKFSIAYWDKAKRSIPDKASTGGFWAPYSSTDGNFTLPVANIVCDCRLEDIPSPARPHISKFCSGGKLRIGCNDNNSPQFHGKKVSTLIVPAVGKPYIDDVAVAPANARYAISGVPTVRNYDDVDYYNYVEPQGWDGSCMAAGWRSWLGIRDGEIWRIYGRTYRYNYIYGMEFRKKIKDEGFSDIICLDGGGSWAIRDKNLSATAGNRNINNIIKNG